MLEKLMKPSSPCPWVSAMVKHLCEQWQCRDHEKKKGANGDQEEHRVKPNYPRKFQRERVVATHCKNRSLASRRGWKKDIPAVGTVGWKYDTACWFHALGRLLSEDPFHCSYFTCSHLGIVSDRSLVGGIGSFVAHALHCTMPGSICNSLPNCFFSVF
jgi:hypothetical protein